MSFHPYLSTLEELAFWQSRFLWWQSTWMTKCLWTFVRQQRSHEECSYPSIPVIRVVEIMTRMKTLFIQQSNLSVDNVAITQSKESSSSSYLVLCNPEERPQTWIASWVPPRSRQLNLECLPRSGFGRWTPHFSLSPKWRSERRPCCFWKRNRKVWWWVQGEKPLISQA